MSVANPTPIEGRILAQYDKEPLELKTQNQKGGISDWTKSNIVWKVLGKIVGLLVEVDVGGETHLVNKKSLDKFINRNLNTTTKSLDKNAIDTILADFITKKAPAVAKKTGQVLLAGTHSDPIIVGTAAALRNYLKPAAVSSLLRINATPTDVEGTKVYKITAENLRALPPDFQKVLSEERMDNIKSFVKKIFTTPTPQAKPTSQGPVPSAAAGAPPAQKLLTDKETAIVESFKGLHSKEIDQDALKAFFKSAEIQSSLELPAPQICDSSLLKKIVKKFQGGSSELTKALNAEISKFEKQESQAQAAAAEEARQAQTSEAAQQAQEDAFKSKTQILNADAFLEMITTGKLPNKENVCIENPRDILQNDRIKKHLTPAFKRVLIQFIQERDVGLGVGGEANLTHFRMTKPKSEFLQLLKMLRPSEARKESPPSAKQPVASQPVPQPVRAEVRPQPAHPAVKPQAAQTKEKALGLDPLGDRDIVFGNLVSPQTGRGYTDSTKKSFCKKLEAVLSADNPTADKLKAVHPQWQKLIVYSFSIVTGEDNPNIIPEELLEKLDVTSLCQLYARSCFHQTAASNPYIYNALHDKLESVASKLTPNQKAELRDYLETFAGDAPDQEDNIGELLKQIA